MIAARPYGQTYGAGVLPVINPAWGRRARHVRLSRCRDGAREIQRRSVTVRRRNKLRSG
jgi:hypothetical protein